ncbi:hypothetical protein OPV22_032140 [Ensete ventricosum]|uniref:Uncharacterized protein n=1 Tax=Ensete ventricosum TaxID=4639 RepID=A0AAV8PQV9_ENSVE|nr:hypothetical protein OPV22_032140 [Ensete ventricosum]
MDMRAGMEAETNAILESLCGPGLFGNLVDSEVTMYLPKPKARYRPKRAPTGSLSSSIYGSPSFLLKLSFNVDYTGFLGLFDRNVIGSLGVISCGIRDCLMELASGRRFNYFFWLQLNLNLEHHIGISKLNWPIKSPRLAPKSSEDGLQLSDEIVKFGSVKKGHNLQSRLVAEEAQSNQGNQIPSVIVRQGALMSIITVTPRPWHGPGSLGCHFRIL